MMNFKDKKVTVMGLGFHDGGVGVAQFFCEQGAIVTVTDFATEDSLLDSLETLKGLPIRFVLGRHEENDFINTDLVVRNPAVPSNSKYLKIAKDHGVPIEMESSLFFKLSPSRNIIAVTGTKGKTTTSSLIAHVLSGCGLKVHLMGNLVKSMLRELTEIQSDSYVVLELSSYQCEGFAPFVDEFRSNKLGPIFSVITNLYPDHLNRYGTMEAYAAAKKNLLLIQTETQVALLNKHNDWTDFFAKEILSEIVYYDENSLPSDIELLLLGDHNRINAGAIYILAKQMNLDTTSIQKALESFSGVEHRLEFVRSVHNVDFYNDSTATNPDAALVGIKTIAELGKKIVLISGGNDKNMVYDELIDEINRLGLRTAILAGTADQHFKKIKPELQLGFYSDFEEAITAAYKEAGEGIVLLSPGATSFNIFRDEFDRGRQFKEIVHSL
jgi:UDP-N-acetylmuramoylalanine--D-glutamate ligase